VSDDDFARFVFLYRWLGAAPAMSSAAANGARKLDTTIG
jgi:hypothetical protein